MTARGDLITVIIKNIFSSQSNNNRQQKHTTE